MVGESSLQNDAQSKDRVILHFVRLVTPRHKRSLLSNLTLTNIRTMIASMLLVLRKKILHLSCFH